MSARRSAAGNYNVNHTLGTHSHDAIELSVINSGGMAFEFANLLEAYHPRSAGVLTLVSDRCSGITTRWVSTACTSARMLRSPASTS